MNAHPVKLYATLLVCLRTTRESSRRILATISCLCLSLQAVSGNPSPDFDAPLDPAEIESKETNFSSLADSLDFDPVFGEEPIEAISGSESIRTSSQAAFSAEGGVGGFDYPFLQAPEWGVENSSALMLDRALTTTDGEVVLPDGFQPLPVLEAPSRIDPIDLRQVPAVLRPPLERRALGALTAPAPFRTGRSFPVGGGRVRYGVDVSAGTAHISNVFGSSNNPQADFVFSLQPSFYLEAGNRVNVRFLWTPSVLRYGRFKELDTVNQTFLFSSRLRGSKVEVGLDAGYLTQSGLFLSSQGQAEQRTLFAKLFASYPLTGKTTVQLGVDSSMQQTNPGGSQFETSFSAWLDYRYSAKTTVGAGVVLGYYAVPDGNTTYQDFLLRLRYTPTAKLLVAAEGGMQFRQSELTDGVTTDTTAAIFNAFLAYQATQKTNLSIRFYRNINVDAFSPDSIQVLTGLELTAAIRILTLLQLEAALSSGYAENDSFAGADEGTYFFNQGTLSLVYMAQNGVNVRLFTSLQQRLRDSNGNNYLSTTTGMTLGLGF